MFKWVAGLGIVTTVATFVFAYIAFVAAKNKLPPSFFWIWNRWDTIHYFGIAKNGYVSTGPERFSIAFFPLYPMAGRVFSTFLPDALLAGLAVSQLAYGALLFYFYKLVRLDESRETAFTIVFYFLIFPTAYFLHAAYTESLYLLFVFSSFYYARKEKWALAGLLGMLAGTTKVIGITLAAALLAEYGYQKQFKIQKFRKDILWLLLFPVGFGIQAWIAGHVYGDSFYFLKVQTDHWHQNLAFPWVGFLSAWKGLFFRPPAERIMVCGAEIVFGLLGFCFTVYSLLRMRISYACYMLTTWLAITCSSFWMSVSRHTLYLFPLYFALARLTHKNQFLHAFVLFICALFYGLFLTRFVQGQWAF